MLETINFKCGLGLFKMFYFIMKNVSKYQNKQFITILRKLIIKKNILSKLNNEI